MSKYIERKIGNNLMRIKKKEGGIHSDLRKLKDGNDREPEFIYLIRKEIKPDMIVVDLGANIGYISLIISELLKDGHLYAIEPEPENYDILSYNIKINRCKNVSCHNLAISNTNGISKFFIGKTSNLGGLIKSKNTPGKEIEVSTITLTDFFKGKELPNFIKMDVEGFEVEIFDGMYEMFKNNPNQSCIIAIEMHPIFYHKKHDIETQFKKFLDIGFKTKYVVSAGVPIPNKFKEMGYTNPINVFKGRGIYNNFSDEDMLYVSCYEHIQPVPGKKDSKKIVRYVILERK